jgi:hypothetical protein
MTSCFLKSILVIASACCMFLPATLRAQTYSNTASVLDGWGSRTGGGAYSNLSACAQPGGIAYTTGGALQNYAGFLGKISLFPGLDTDGDGLANEIDGDNDNDGLADGGEVSGSAFAGFATTDPNDPDSDNDGMDDNAEALVMFDPNDPRHVLRMVSIRKAGNNVELAWIGRGGGTVNEVGACTNLAAGPPTNVVNSAAYPGGTAPWYKQTNAYTHVGGAAGYDKRFYGVKVVAP